MTEGLGLERDGAVLTITLDRPDVHNALDWKTRDALVAALEEASADLGVRAVVLTGAGERAFCTGADLRVPMPAPPKPDGAPDRAQGDVARGIATGWQRVITAVLDCEKVVIAAVNGTAAGAGMHLALACDVVVMAEIGKAGAGLRAARHRTGCGRRLPAHPAGRAARGEAALSVR